MFDQMFNGLVSKVRLMVGRAVISAIRSGGEIHQTQMHLLADEIADDVEMMQQYGFVSVPHRGAEAAVIFIGGNRDAGLVIATHDRRYRLTLEEGEVALHDDLGQKVHLTRDGIVIDGGGKKITLKNTPEVFMETTLLKVSGSINAGGDVKDSAGTMSAMRTVFNSHTHSEKNVLNGPTTGPSASM